MTDPEAPNKYSVYEQDGLPAPIIAYLAKTPLVKTGLINGVMLSTFMLCMIVAVAVGVFINRIETKVLARRLWDGEPTLLLADAGFGFVFAIILTGICFSGWATLILIRPIKGSTEYFAICCLNVGLSGRYTSLNRSLNRIVLRRNPTNLASDPPRYLRAFAWRMAGIWGWLGLWLTGLALILLYFDMNYVTVVTRMTIHHSPYFSTAITRHDLNDVERVEAGCAYRGGKSRSLLLEYRLAFRDGAKFNLSDMNSVSGATIDILERFDDRFAARQVPVRRARFEGGIFKGDPMKDTVCFRTIKNHYSPTEAQRWIKLLRLRDNLP